ncbi:MAG: hypothetical protein LBS24_03930 [Clostridiales Family XIII bacterium]|jgi:hypothetical protein|nr:hypothetical protein [Clostridiales Family XIII bacterium]
MEMLYLLILFLVVSIRMIDTPLLPNSAPDGSGVRRVQIHNGNLVAIL